MAGGPADDFHNEVFEDEETSDQEEKESQNSTGRFPNELRQMMYGFGDDKNSYAESVNVMEDLVVHFITEATKKCMDIGRNGKVSVHDLLFLVRKDKQKYSRILELLQMNEELRNARKAFNETEFGTK